MPDTRTKRPGGARANKHGQLITTIGPQPGPQEKFLSTPADICVYGGQAGGGKTYGLLLNPLKHIKKAGFSMVIFRRTSPQITNEGALWDTSAAVYAPLGCKPRVSSTEWISPWGSTIRFSHLEHDKTVLDWQGAQVPAIGFDELTHFSKHQFLYMLSRNRNASAARVRPYIRATCNPDPDHFIADWISYYLTEDGYPDYSKSGELRWFLNISDEIIWAKTPEELQRRYGQTKEPKSFTFIPAKLSDNRILESLDPTYRSNLEAMNAVERERLLGGNWKIRHEGGGKVFNRNWFRFMGLPNDARIKSLRYVRGWDKAATAEGGDWCIGVRMARIELTDALGVWYFIDDVVRVQMETGERDALIRRVAEADGPEVKVAIEQEPGSAGVDAVFYTISLLRGFRAIPIKTTGSKLTRAQALSSQVQQGFVALTPAPWNEPYLRIMHAFPTKGVHDDDVDASSCAFDALNQEEEWLESYFPI